MPGGIAVQYIRHCFQHFISGLPWKGSAIKMTILVIFSPRTMTWAPILSPYNTFWVGFQNWMYFMTLPSRGKPFDRYFACQCRVGLRYYLVSLAIILKVWDVIQVYGWEESIIRKCLIIYVTEWYIKYHIKYLALGDRINNFHPRFDNITLMGCDKDRSFVQVWHLEGANNGKCLITVNDSEWKPT